MIPNLGPPPAVRPVAATPAAPVAQAPAAVKAVPNGDRLVTTAPAAPTHADIKLVGQDGASIAVRTTLPTGAPKAIVVMQQGTYGEPGFFDQMGEKLAARGIAAYAVGSRVQSQDAKIHAADLDAVVKKARADYPGVPITVMGTSLGAAIAMDWAATRNPDHLPVVLLSPVVLPKYLGPIDLLKIAVGLVIPPFARGMQVHSPMSKGKLLTTNPTSPEANLPNAAGMKVPARLFGDVLKMTLRTAWHGHGMASPLHIAQAGADQVATNWSARAFRHLIAGSDKPVTFAGAAHDLSQESHRKDLVDTLATWILPK